MNSEPTGFLYPFIEADERDAAPPAGRPGRLGPGKLAESRHAVGRRPSSVLRKPPSRGGRGPWRTASGGAAGSWRSATAAARPTPKGRWPCSANPRSAAGRPLPAISLVDDRAVVTALANDVGFDLVFSRQIIAHGRPGDMAVGFSTSGDSVNVRRALEEASAPAPLDHRPGRLRGRRHGQQ